MFSNLARRARVALARRASALEELVALVLIVGGVAVKVDTGTAMIVAGVGVLVSSYMPMRRG